MKELLIDLQLEGDDRPLETRVRAFVENAKLVVWYQDTECNVIDWLNPQQKLDIWWEVS
jgi:hypothetical protein